MTIQKNAEQYFSRLFQALNAVDLGAVSEFISLTRQCRESGSTVYVCGNGGSASTAEHWVTDLTHLPQDLAIRSISLSSNLSQISATGNDLDFNEIFAREIQILGKPGDVLVVISASGNSPNLVRAVSKAKAKGLVTVAVVGFDGGKLASLADLCMLAPTAKGDYGVAEDCHLILNHLVKEMICSLETGT